MNFTAIARANIFLLFVMTSCLATAEAGPVDPLGVLRKPIPDKLVVLTFDDGPASHATVVAPILKAHGFGGSFYVCDFDSFKTRKDWYLTWRQMRALVADGFEVGNHTKGHAGGASIGPFLEMEDQLLAHDVSKPTTIAWPVHAVNKNTFPDLAAHGYIFGRDSHFRPYRPTVDNPFDIPCLGCGSIEEFVKSVRQATDGKIVVLCYHGVPDMEHPAVSLDPEVFKVQMQYLKDNQYQVIALRDLVEYIDPVKAAKLPPTANDIKDQGPVALAAELKTWLTVNSTKPKPPTAMMPRLSGTGQDKAVSVDSTTLPSDVTVGVVKNKDKEMSEVITGSVRLVKNGAGRLILPDKAVNNYSGGTVVNGGTLFIITANQALGSGPLT